MFTGLTGSTFTLTTGGSISGVISNNVFGLQIVADAPDAVAAPLPPTLLAMAGGLGVFGLVRRRRA